MARPRHLRARARRWSSDATHRPIPAGDRYPAWSPDGRRLAFVRMTRDAPANCSFADLAGPAETRVAPCGNRDEATGAWTPDGRALLTSHAPSSHSRSRAGASCASSLDTGRSDRLLTDPPPGVVGDHTPVPSPDGRHVAFIRHAQRRRADLYVAPLDGGAARRVTCDDADLTGVDWSRRRRSLVYSSDRAGGYSLWRVASRAVASRR